MMDWIRANWVELTAAGTLVVGLARLVIKLTPTTKDDTFWARFVEPLLNWLALSVGKKTDVPIKPE